MAITSAINITLDAFCVVISIILIGCLRYGGDYPQKKLQSFFAVMLTANLMLSFCSMLSWIYDGNAAAYAYPIVLASNIMLYFFWYAARTYSSVYIFTYVSTRVGVLDKFLIIYYGIGAASVVLLIASQFTGWIYYIDGSNIFHRSNLYWLAYIGPTLIYLADLVLLLTNRKKIGVRDFNTFIFFELLPMLGLAMMIFRNGVLFLNTGLTLSLLVLYIRIQIEGARRLESELNESRISLMLSQIQPHFLYNALSAIEDLCDVDIEQTKTAVNDFAHYLRGNLESVGQSKLIPFENELEHVETYLSLEKLRFRDKLNIALEIETSDFLIPPLTVQPIVENAVRHGLAKKNGVGNVQIGVAVTESAFVITVKDNGIGFEQGEEKGDNRIHVGIQNVRGRLQAQCGGTLEIESSHGIGTTAVITIPKSGGAI